MYCLKHFITNVLLHQRKRKKSASNESDSDEDGKPLVRQILYIRASIQCTW